ncbi:MAG: hypothetical protein J6C97_03820 [Clostridia bacterium]|nr:hypothetical protein [Clostridia bacterium]
MRKLIIKRNKTACASLCKTKFYIEDENGDTEICGTKCKKLGEIKNGEEQTFDIEEKELKIYAICDLLSRNTCNDVFLVPQGDQGVYLSGKHKYNPAVGNPFVFDNNTNLEGEVNRKKGTKIGIVIMVISAIIGGIAGFLLVNLL